MRTTGSTTRTSAIAKAARSRPWRGNGENRAPCRLAPLPLLRRVQQPGPKPPAPSGECLGKISRRLRDDLVRIAPHHLTLARNCDRAHRQAALLEQPRAVARAADRLAGS